MIVCVGRDHWARRPPGLFRHFVSVGEGLAPPAGFVPYILIWGTFRRPGGKAPSKKGEGKTDGNKPAPSRPRRLRKTLTDLNFFDTVSLIFLCYAGFSIKQRRRVGWIGCFP